GDARLADAGEGGPRQLRLLAQIVLGPLPQLDLAAERIEPLVEGDELPDARLLRDETHDEDRLAVRPVRLQQRPLRAQRAGLPAGAFQVEAAERERRAAGGGLQEALHLLGGIVEEVRQG